MLNLCKYVCSKLTRESGTDFPIPVVPGVTDNETEKLIREKDEEVRHATHELDSHHEHEHDHEHEPEHTSDHHVYSQPSPETRSDQMVDEALWVSLFYLTVVWNTLQSFSETMSSLKNTCYCSIQTSTPLFSASSLDLWTVDRKCCT